MTARWDHICHRQCIHSPGAYCTDQVSSAPDGALLITPTGGAPATILLGDLKACKADVHVVDRVLLPTLVRPH